MTKEAVFLLVVSVVIYLSLWWRQELLGRKLRDQEGELHEVRTVVTRLQDTLHELSLSPGERQVLRHDREHLQHESRFLSASVLTLADAQKWKPNETIRLATIDDKIEYRHDHLEGNEVHGFFRSEYYQAGYGLEEWHSFYFLAFAEQCTTTFHEGEWDADWEGELDREEVRRLS